jgi:hypothetical protein
MNLEHGLVANSLPLNKTNQKPHKTLVLWGFCNYVNAGLTKPLLWAIQWAKE